jgi:hypothetical protein
MPAAALALAAAALALAAAALALAAAVLALKTTNTSSDHIHVFRYGSDLHRSAICFLGSHRCLWRLLEEQDTTPANGAQEVLVAVSQR